jgi:paraquat-inducible protein B
VARDRQTATGAFVFGGLVLALAAIILFGNFRPFSPVTRAAVVFQGSISGLSVGAPVTFRGVRVGSVQAITLQYDALSNTAYIPVIIDLEPERVRVTGEGAGNPRPPDLPALVQRGMRAELEIQSFVTGQSQINLDFAPSAPALLHPNITKLPEIPTRPSTFQRVQQGLSELPLADLAKHADGALQNIQDLAEKLDNSLPPLVTNLTSRSEELSRTIAVATNAITDLQGRLDDTLAHFTQVAVTGDQQISQRGNDLRLLLASSTQAMEQARATLTDARSLVSSRAGARANLEATIRDLAAAATSLRGFASDVEHNPQLLLTGRRQ